MKRIGWAAMAGIVLAAFSVFGCGDRKQNAAPGAAGSSEDSKAKPSGVIGVSALTLANPFFRDLADSLKEEAAKHGYRVLITAGEFDVAKQKDQVADFIVQKVDAIVLCPCNSQSIGTSIAAANEAGIPVFTADIACLAKDAKVVCHVATDNLGGGRLAAKALQEALGGTGKVAILDHPEAESVMLRTRGFNEEIAKTPGISVVATLPAGGSKDKAFPVAEDILQAHPDLNGFFAINDPTALGALAAIEKAGKAGKVTIVGFDAMLEACQAIKDGKIYATIVQHPKEIGRKTAQAIARYMAGEELEREILIPGTIYRKAEADKDPALTPSE
jgi:ribose transport system substrate-binding protein